MSVWLRLCFPVNVGTGANVPEANVPEANVPEANVPEKCDLFIQWRFHPVSSGALDHMVKPRTTVEGAT